ncbi:MAG: hypothetical protein ACRDPG_10940, partial [Nocardioidaceae bacterium]
ALIWDSLAGVATFACEWLHWREDNEGEGPQRTGAGSDGRDAAGKRGWVFDYQRVAVLEFDHIAFFDEHIAVVRFGVWRFRCDRMAW